MFPLGQIKVIVIPPSFGRNLASEIHIHESLGLPKSFSESRLPKKVSLRLYHLRVPRLLKCDVWSDRVCCFLDSNGPSAIAGATSQAQPLLGHWGQP